MIQIALKDDSILNAFACFPEADDLCAHSPIPEEYDVFEDESLENDNDETEQFGSALEQAEVENESDDMGEAIVKCIFESLDIIQEDTGASLNTFQDLLCLLGICFVEVED
ncbi:hypothetical protein AWC38_SpisGene10958 [Stylophora pistillata]|uniref:Uncharacterized protein n=1 Tax=Stylophora pistillata TaxID=50429 RepID=A0A2B4S798_STYPI|nr:hypothetical protein AWC38_SpisGene10958 [Stylophora pistillata]